MLEKALRDEVGIEVKLGDFGFATQLGEDEMIKFYCGTPLNMAPEILNDQFYNHKVDIWSLGIAIYEALFR
jgi:serine/threonine protein kinase